MQIGGRDRGWPRAGRRRDGREGRVPQHVSRPAGERRDGRGRMMLGRGRGGGGGSLCLQCSGTGMLKASVKMVYSQR